MSATLLANPIFPIVRFARTVTTLAAAGAGRTLLQCDDGLFALDESRLLAAALAGDPLELGHPADSPRLLPDEPLALRVDRAAGIAMWVRDGLAEWLNLDEPEAIRRVPLPAELGPPVEAVVAPGCGQALVVALDDGDLDLFAYDVYVVPIRRSAAPPVRVARSSTPPRVGWLPSAGAFLVLDTCESRLWRVAPGGRPCPVEFPPAAGRALCGLFVHPGEPCLAVLADQRGERFSTLHDFLAGAAGLAWDRMLRLRDGLVTGVCWRPGRRELAVARAQRRKTTLDLLAASGVVLDSFELPRRWSVDAMSWTSDGQRLLVGCASAVGAWQPKA